ncbi:phage head closure protein [Methylocystis sp. JAN1]|uniref:phage head closure protein n=1 Tax=Methylocystis sp. JAN1 TaxID=3397211 RepID=UPI003FA23F0C
MSAHPTIGQLRQRVTIEAPVDAPDDIGGINRSFAPLAQVWARIETPGAQEQFAEQRLEQAKRCVVTIRWRGDVTSQMRVLFRGRVLIVRSVEDRDETRRFVTCLCEEIS